MISLELQISPKNVISTERRKPTAALKLFLFSRMSARIFVQGNMSSNHLHAIPNTWQAFSAWNSCLRLKIKVLVILNTECLARESTRILQRIATLTEMRAEDGKEDVRSVAGIGAGRKSDFTLERQLAGVRKTRA